MDPNTPDPSTERIGPVPEVIGFGEPATVPDASATRTKSRSWGRPMAFAAAGIVVGGALAGSMSAMAADSGASASPSRSASVDESQPQRSDEKLLTGDTADRVTAAVLAAYPGASIVRVETDSDGVYEAHIVTADGQQIEVAVDKGFTVTGTRVGGPGGHGGPGKGGSDAGAAPEASASTA